MRKKQTIALLGGSFDPVHKGHLDIASLLTAPESLDKKIAPLIRQKIPCFDALWLVPDAQPLLGKKFSASTEHRLKMLELACNTHAAVSVFDYKIRHQIEGGTWVFLKKLFSDPAYSHYQFHFVIGADSLNTFDKWHRASELAQMIPFIVVPRGNHNAPCPLLQRPPHNTDLLAFKGLLNTAASRNIRAKTQKPSQSLPPIIHDYIVQHHLYNHP